MALPSDSLSCILSDLLTFFWYVHLINLRTFFRLSSRLSSRLRSGGERGLIRSLRNPELAVEVRLGPAEVGGGRKKEEAGNLTQNCNNPHLAGGENMCKLPWHLSPCSGQHLRKSIWIIIQVLTNMMETANHKCVSSIDSCWLTRFH